MAQLLVSDPTSCSVQSIVALGYVHRDGTDFQEPDFGTISGLSSDVLFSSVQCCLTSTQTVRTFRNLILVWSLIRRPVQFSPMLRDVHRDGSDFQQLDFRTDSDL